MMCRICRRELRGKQTAFCSRECFRKGAVKGMEEWRKNNPERAKEIVRRGYERNKEKIKESSRLWKKNNPDKYREMCRKSERKRRLKYPEYYKSKKRCRNSKKINWCK